MIVEQTDKVWLSRQWRDGIVTSRDLTTRLHRSFLSDVCQETVTSPIGCTRRTLKMLPLGEPPVGEVAIRGELDPTDLDGIGNNFRSYLRRILEEFDFGDTHVVVREDFALTSFSTNVGGAVSVASRQEHRLYFGLQVRTKEDIQVTTTRHESVNAPLRVMADSMMQEVGQRESHLTRRPIRTGEYAILLSRELSGLFAHECLGHLLEVDLAESALLEQMDKSVNSEVLFDVFDEPNSPHLEIPWDDEGVITSKNQLVEKSRVCRFLSDRARGDGSGFGRLTTTGLRPRMRNLRLCGNIDQALELPSQYIEPILPLRAGCRGTRFAMLFGGGTFVNGDRREDVGPFVTSGEVVSTLRSITYVGRSGEWLKDGGVCSKGGGEGLFVGAWGPDVILGAAQCSAVDLRTLAKNFTRVEDINGL